MCRQQNGAMDPSIPTALKISRGRRMHVSCNYIHESLPTMCMHACTYKFWAKHIHKLSDRKNRLPQ